MEDKLGFLSTVDIFQDLSLDEVADIGKRTIINTCLPGRLFYNTW